MTLTPDQQAARAVAIGGSDCAAVLGMSKWKTARQLFHEKRGDLVIEREETEEQWFGQQIEPIVRQWYANRTGRIIQQPTKTLIHPQHEFMVGHIDGFCRDELTGHRGYEGKSAIRAVGWGAIGTDQIPTDALFQVQHYMSITGWRVFDVCVLLGRQFRIYTVEADSELQELIVDAEAEFAKRLTAGDPPPLDYEHPSALTLLKRVYAGTTGEIVQATPQALLWRAEMQDAARQQTEAKHRHDTARAKLLDFMGEAALLQFSDGRSLRRLRIEKEAYTVAAQSYVDARMINTPREAHHV